MDNKEFVWTDLLACEWAGYLDERLKTGFPVGAITVLLNDWKISKIPKILFTTDDGYEAIDPEEVLLYVSQYKIRERKAKNMSDLQNKRFKSKEKADEFILMNKPVLSLNDILETTIKKPDVNNPHWVDVKQLAKSKIDKQQ